MAPCHFTALLWCKFQMSSDLSKLSNDVIYSFLQSLCKVLRMYNPRTYDKYDMTCVFFKYTL